MALLSLVADLGGTNMRTALVTDSGALVERQMESTRADAGREAVMESLASALLEVKATNDSSSLIGVGLSVASPIDSKTGEMYAPPQPSRRGMASVLTQEVSREKARTPRITGQ
jgi:glucokinase